eukprot:GFYU01010653.1.p1 GENE.GFYU01010653.1~~GFYU01010653.1.p1  ORF type:complete len:166 (-),score=24.71 GFYU01010653.1:190-687(-)
MNSRQRTQRPGKALLRLASLVIVWLACFIPCCLCSSVDGNGELAALTDFEVPSHPLWVHTTLAVNAGDRIHIAATGKWTDWYIECDASGYKSITTAPFKSLLRFPSVDFFTLIACVGESLTDCTAVGTSHEWTVPTSGELVFFANDVEHMYWNNYGHVSVNVTVL